MHRGYVQEIHINNTIYYVRGLSPTHMLMRDLVISQKWCDNNTNKGCTTI